MITKSPFQMVLSVSLLFHFSRKFCQTKQYRMASLGSAFRIRSKYLKETIIKRPLQVWKKLALTFLNVTMDICYKIFFSFAKNKDKRIKKNLEKKLLIRNLPEKTCLWPKTLHAMLIYYRFNGCLLTVRM